MAELTRFVGVKLPPSLFRRLLADAEAHGESLSAAARRLLDGSLAPEGERLDRPRLHRTNVTPRRYV